MDEMAKKSQRSLIELIKVTTDENKKKLKQKQEVIEDSRQKIEAILRNHVKSNELSPIINLNKVIRQLKVQLQNAIDRSETTKAEINLKMNELTSITMKIKKSIVETAQIRQNLAKIMNELKENETKTKLENNIQTEKKQDDYKFVSPMPPPLVPSPSLILSPLSHHSTTPIRFNNKDSLNDNKSSKFTPLTLSFKCNFIFLFLF
jgi:hypothetical protein